MGGDRHGGNRQDDVKIAIIGSAAHSIKAPFGDPSWEIWGANAFRLPRQDRWFELHEDASIDAYEGHRQWLADLTCPLYLKDAKADIPNGKPYPLDAMVSRYGTWFFTSTIAYMLAMAIEEHPEEIGLWGVDMADETEYATQKDGCRFFIQIAMMQGINVRTPPEAEVVTPGHLYCFPNGDGRLRTKVAARVGELRARVQQAQLAREQAMMRKLMLQGYLEISISKEDAQKLMQQTEAELAQAERDALTLDGGLQDILHIERNWL